MNRSFDKILVRRIREVFDNHHEPVDQGAWKDMQRRLDVGRNLRVVYITRASRIAAVLLVLFLVFWPFSQQIRDYFDSGETRMIQNEPSYTASQKNRESDGKESKAMAFSEDSAEQEADSQPRKNLMARKDRNNMIQHETKNTEEIAKETRGILREEEDMKKISPLQQRMTVDQNQQPAMLAHFESEGQSSTWDNISPDKNITEGKERINLGVALSTLYNYTSKATKSDLNFSGGLMSEIDLLPNLSMHTGVIVSRQYFTTQDNLPAGRDRALYSDLSASEGSYSSANVTSTSNRVELVGLDVPVNLRYRYRDISLTAGISSVTYIQEQYSHRFSAEYVNYIYDESNNLMDTEKVIRSQSVKESYNPLHQVDLANILNLSLGYHFTFDRSQLVLEPYMKHPLGDLTSQDIRFGARGIRLKFQF
ncbi:MAG: hypothetical protein ACOC59_01260 [Bacteroidota bacterium]